MVEGMVARGYDARLCRALFQPDQGLWRIWLSRKPCGRLWLAGLCVELAEMPSSGGVHLRAAEFAADGFLCAGATGARCAGAWGGGAPRRCECERVGSGDCFAVMPLSAAGPAPRFSPDRRLPSGMGQRPSKPRVHPGRFSSIEDLARRAALPPAALRKLADADAFGSLGKGRRDALWEARRTPPDQLPLFAFADAAELGAEPDARLPAMPLSEEVVADYQMLRLSLKAHPMQFLRERFTAKAYLSCADTNAAPDGRREWPVQASSSSASDRARAMPFSSPSRTRPAWSTRCSGRATWKSSGAR
jgi:hypothetical protein